ncbi:MAG TPA: SURF1 family protein [Acidimicrobiales bacterium]|nr:SURF1 family protein [Acidimicrobiales bacterium]
MYRFLLKPRWIVSHVLVLTLVVVMVNLGLWQLHRLDQKRDLNALIESRTEAPVRPVDEVLPAAADFDDADEVVFRPVTATGSYLAEDEVVVRGRSYEGRSGAWILTPLRLDDGTAVVVNRGWVPLQAGLEVQPEWAPPAGEVRVEGLLVATQTRGRFGSIDPEGERLDELARADVGRIQQQVDEDLVPAVLQLDQQHPAQSGDFPVAVGRPSLDEGPHLNYAGQWFIFSAIAAVGYGLILRRVARSRSAGAADAAAEAPATGPPRGDEPAVAREPVEAADRG